MAEHDIAALWEAHCRGEFETRDVDFDHGHDGWRSRASTTSRPWPAALGHDELKRFYKYHFVGVNPPDFRLTSISRTVGADRLIDEFVVHFTHTTEIDWMLPGIAPTGREVNVPTVAIVAVRRRQAGARAHLLGSGLGAGGGSACSAPRTCPFPARSRRAR